MSVVQLKVAAAVRSALTDEGFKIPSIFDAYISTESRFEAPLYMNASIIYGSKISIGAFTSIAGGKFGNVSIGRYCAIGEHVAIGQHEHPTTWLTTSRMSHVPDMHNWREISSREKPKRRNFQRTPFYDSNPNTSIGNDVWIGYGAYIRAGISIGDGAIIAARSVVTKDVPAFSVVGGVPAKVIKMRYSDEIIKKCLAMKWWKYCLYDINTDLSSPQVALEEIERMIQKNQIQAYFGKTMSPNQMLEFSSHIFK